MRRYKIRYLKHNIEYTCYIGSMLRRLLDVWDDEQIEDVIDLPVMGRAGDDEVEVERTE